ncbi:MAG: conjugal transfer protein TraX [Clostridium sp.]|jgi:hypothetical protein|nr:conjugal transfer protein TraX [Clostridium sp.]
MEPAAKKWGISASTLKLIAIFMMFLDHVGAAVVARLIRAAPVMLPQGTAELLSRNRLQPLYWCLRVAGRPAFPMFCFLLVEGFQKTKDVKKYALRLGLFALLSEVPFDLAIFNTPYTLQHQNVFFTLLAGLLTLIALRAVEERCRIRGDEAVGRLPETGQAPAAGQQPETGWASKTAQLKKVVLSGFVILFGMAAAWFLNTDYSWAGVLAIVAMYLFRRFPLWQLSAGVLALLLQSWIEGAALLAIFPIRLYNGRKGMKLKYFFYAFYPAHLLLLYGASVLLVFVRI